MKYRFAVYLLLTASPLLAQTKAEPVSADHAAKMTQGLALFKTHVRPVLEQQCLKCHGGKRVESELDLSDRANLLKGGQHGPAVVPGKSADSLLVKLIRHQRVPHMPREGSKLPDAVIAHIAAWIDLGAPYDRPLVAARTVAKAWTAREVPAEAKAFWSFAPLARVTPPAVKDAASCRTPVDRFLRARQEAAGLAPNSPAARQQLLRRAYFDLTGLPPTPEEAKAFLDDASPDAYARLVDRLLASPHYGERWARHWLDLARFAESHGFEHDYDRPTAYHYRDFVIQALNRDLPYDTFVKWQIAGDEYAPTDPLALKATGFLAAGVHSTQITKSEVEKHRYDELDDKLNTLSTAMLGLTVGCARCHDHKYDPIPQRDYYRLLSTFTTTVRSEIELSLDPAGDARAKVMFDQAHAPYVAALRDYETNELPKKLTAWAARQQLDRYPWVILEPTAVHSKEGATLKAQPDGTILASGKNPKFDTYTITATAPLKNLKALRLEALTHPSIVKGGPGRATNGNFALSDLKLFVNAQPVRWQSARATFEQQGLPVAAVIDADPKSAWAIDPQFGKDHAAVFEPAQPFAMMGASTLVVTLRFENNDGHNFGRFRLAVSSAAPPYNLTAPGLPPRVREALARPTSDRSAEHTRALLDWYRTLDPGWQALHKKMHDHLATAPKPSTVKALVATEGLPAIRLHTQGDDFLPATHYLRRGDPDNKEGVAEQGFLQVLMPATDAMKKWQTPPPAGSRTSYRRRALADWLTDTEQGAGNLLARVIVNRLWQHHFGRGLVATPSDFGQRGERPSHPELLDYLAGELVKNGWRLKPIHRLIMTSAVYQQASATDETRTKLDRDNKLFWRQPVRRLEAEVIRDTLLAVSGQLDRAPFGPGTLDEYSRRRSIFFTVKRSKLVPMMVIFDAPEPLGPMAERPTTTIAPQALHLLNSPQARNAARHLAARLASSSTSVDAVRQGYLLALARLPSPEELADNVAFLDGQRASYPEANRREAALVDFCQVLLCLNEFVYVE